MEENNTKNISPKTTETAPVVETRTPPYAHALQILTKKKFLWGFGFAILILGVFQAGVSVGFHKAAFSYRMGEGYYRAFGERSEHMLPMIGREEFPGTNGSIGKILAVTLPSLTVEDKGGIEKVIVITDDTKIRSARDTVRPDQLHVGDMIIAIGNTDENGTVNAQLIRLLPPPPQGFPPATPPSTTTQL